MSKNPLIVKLKKLPNKIYGQIKHVNKNSPSCFVNSFPKSGTHLLSQVFDKSSIVSDYGRFITSASSIRFKQKTSKDILKEISFIRPGELVKGHVLYDNDCIEKLSLRKIPTFFIYRDLRSVLVSEIYYLSEINKFHRLAKYFPKTLSKDDLLSIAINGLPGGGPTGLYTDIYTRFEPFLKWIGDERVYSVKFESLIENKEETILSIWKHFQKITDMDFDIEKAVNSSIDSIDPNRSHTFRSGNTKSWSKDFSANNLEKFNLLCKDINEKIGYL